MKFKAQRERDNEQLSQNGTGPILFAYEFFAAEISNLEAECAQLRDELKAKKAQVFFTSS